MDAHQLAEDIRALITTRTRARTEFIENANRQIIEYNRIGLLRYYKYENAHAYKWCLDIHIGSLFDPEHRVGYDEGVHSLEEYNSLMDTMRQAFPEPDFNIRPMNKKKAPRLDNYGVYKWNIRISL